MSSNTGHKFVTGLLDGGPYVITVVSFLVSVVALLALSVVDIVTGQVTMDHILGGSDPVTGMGLLSWAISFATTGLVIAVIAGFGKAREATSGVDKRIVWVVGGAMVLLVMMDTYLDSLSVDVIRFGAIVDLSTAVTPPEAKAIYVARALVAGISLVNEPLIAISVLIFPLLKKLFNSVVGSGSSYQPSQQYKPQTQPGSRPQSQPSFTQPRPQGQAGGYPGTQGQPRPAMSPEQFLQQQRNKDMKQ
jgi:hypothetical protein